MAVAAFPSYPFKYDDVFAPVVAVAHKHKLHRDMFALCFHNNRTEDIPRSIHPCKVCGKAVKVIQPAVEMVHLPVVLQHTDNIKPTAKYSFDERLIGEPCVHQDVFCRDAGGEQRDEAPPIVMLIAKEPVVCAL